MPVWDYLAPVREASELEREGPSVEDPNRLSVLGSPGQWRTSPLQQWGLWADASEGRAFIKATQGDGNFLTQSINLIGGALGFEPNAVPIEDQRAAFANLEIDREVPFSLAQQDIRPIYRDRQDPNFNPTEELKNWKEDNPALAGILDLKMPGLDDALEETNNQEWFKYVINLSLSRIQAEQKIENRNSRIGTTRWLGEAATDGFGNYLYKDPSFAPSLLFFAGAQGLKQGSVLLADDILRMGAQGGQKGSLASRSVAGTVRYIGSAPAMAHGGLASRVGHATALGVELGAYGAALDTSAQLDMMRVWNSVFEGTDQEREFSYQELFLMSGLMGALGFGLGGAIGGFLPKRTSAVREGVVAATNGNINSRAAKRGYADPASSAIMQSDDMVQVSILNKLERLANSTEADANDLYWLLDERLIRDENGLLPHQLDDVLDELLDVGLQDFIRHAKAAARIEQFLIQEEAVGTGQVADRPYWFGQHVDAGRRLVTGHDESCLLGPMVVIAQSAPGRHTSTDIGRSIHYTIETIPSAARSIASVDGGGPFKESLHSFVDRQIDVFFANLIGQPGEAQHVQHGIMNSGKEHFHVEGVQFVSELGKLIGAGNVQFVGNVEIQQHRPGGRLAGVHRFADAVAHIRRVGEEQGSIGPDDEQARHWLAVGMPLHIGIGQLTRHLATHGEVRLAGVVDEPQQRNGHSQEQAGQDAQQKYAQQCCHRQPELGLPDTVQALEFLHIHEPPHREDDDRGHSGLGDIVKQTGQGDSGHQDQTGGNDG